MRGKWIRLIIIGLGLFVLVGCDQGLISNDDAPTHSSPTNSSPSLTATLLNNETPAPPSQTPRKTDISSAPTPSDPTMQGLVEQAKADLARRLSVPADQIELIEAIRVDWPDSSLGCPEPGGEYLHVWIVGELIRLRVDGRVYEYHSGQNRPPFLCQPTKKAP